MAYSDRSSDIEEWKNKAKKSVSAIEILTKDKDDLIYTIMKRNCYDLLIELIDQAVKMQSLIQSAEETFSAEPLDKFEVLQEKDERIDNMHGDILNVKSCVEERLINTLETVKTEMEEIRESTAAIAEYMDQEKSQTEEMGLPRLQPVKKWTQARRRQCNLMVFGFFEKETDYSLEVMDILRHVGVNSKADEFYITEIKTNVSYKKSILRVEFDSPGPVQVAMLNARRLKSFDKYEVYIANDLSYQERARLRLKVQELKSKREQQPEIYWTIRGCKIVSLGPRRILDTVERETVLKRIHQSDTSDNEEEKFTYRKLSLIEKEPEVLPFNPLPWSMRH